MWDFTRRSDDVPFLVIADSDNDGPSPANEKAPPTPALAERLILWGRLRPVHAQRPSGVALALVAPDRDAVDWLIVDERAMIRGYTHVEIHAWEFGGRR